LVNVERLKRRQQLRCWHSSPMAALAGKVTSSDEYRGLTDLEQRLVEKMA
jgi:hypothetical protein